MLSNSLTLDRNQDILPLHLSLNVNGGVAQMVERSLSMREVPGSIPGASTTTFFPLPSWLAISALVPPRPAQTHCQQKLVFGQQS